MKFKFESLNLASPPVFDGVKVNNVKLFSFEISNNREFYGKMFCKLRNFKGEIKKFKFEYGKFDLKYFRVVVILTPLRMDTQVLSRENHRSFRLKRNKTIGNKT